MYKIMNLIAILAMILFAASSYAAKQWIGAEQGLWSVAENWSPAGVPAGSDEILLYTTSSLIDASVAAESGYTKLGSGGGVTMTGGTWAVGGDFLLGLDGTGTLDLSGGEIVQSTGMVRVGYNSDGIVNMSGGSFKQNGAKNSDWAVIAGGYGEFNLSAGEVTLTGRLNLGRYGEAVLNVNGGTFNAGNGLISTVGNSDARAVINVTDGTLNTTYLRMGHTSGTTSTITVSGGILHSDAEFTLAHRYDDVHDVLNVSGGLVEAESFNLGNAYATNIDASSGTANITGGVVDISGALNIGRKAAGYLNIDEGKVYCGSLVFTDGVTGLIDIEAGELIVRDDVSADIGDYIAAGYITGYGVARNVVVEVLEGNTVITADPTLAYKAAMPDPANYAVDVDHDVTLSWLPGESVKSSGGHVLYFGTSPEDVSETASPMQVLDTNSYSLTGLELGVQYYWRVDQIDESENVYTGSIWRFTVADYLVIDDFEKYQNDIDSYWTAGGSSGADVDESQIIFRSGVQSMELSYNNGTAPFYSEASLSAADMGTGSDWQQMDVQALTIYLAGTYLGSENNAAQPVYAEISDGTSTARFYYEDENGNIDFQATKFLGTETGPQIKAFNIALQDIASGGVNLSSIASLTIGVGSKDDPAEAGYGSVYVDDIRLYVPRCVAAEGPQGDFNGDCIFDTNDIELFAGEWLAEEYYVTGQALDTTGLIVYYTMEDVSSTTINDSSGNGFNADMYLDASVVYDSTRGSNVLEFDGYGFAEITGSETQEAFKLSEALTISMWINPNGSEDWARIIYKPGAYGVDLPGGWAGDTLLFYCAGTGVGNWGDLAGGYVPDNQWHHIACVFDINSSPAKMAFYIDGVLTESAVPSEPIDTSKTFSVTIGQDRPSFEDTQYRGMVDEIMLFNRALSEEEVAGLAVGAGNQQLQPLNELQEEMDSSGNGRIDLPDLGEAAAEWLTEKLWPDIQ
jgi:hypothetical protein